MFRKKTLATAIAACLPLSVVAVAESTDTESSPRTMSRLPTINVVGDLDANVARQPGAVTIVDRERLDRFQPRSTEEALANVPGIYVKPEEESAIVFNVGVRGLSSADFKTLVLEDGVPVAPGLFVGNARYFNPRIQRMDSVEVLKGTSSLRYGPNNIGGVINFRTKQPEDGVVLEATAGTWDTYRTTLELGGSSPSGDGIFGAVLTRIESDGFQDKGYETSDAMIKAGTAIGEDQWLGVKFSYTQNDANISYRGLFLDEFRSGVRDNPAPDDFFLQERQSFDVNHYWAIDAATELNTLVYWSQTTRDYWRFAVDQAASADAGSWVYTDNLNGNNRAFERFGVESRVIQQNRLFDIPGEAQVGVRYMNEQMQDQTVLAVRDAPRTANPDRGGLGRDRVDTADSFALYAQNRFDLTNRWSLTPAVRVEYYEQRRKDLQTNRAADTANVEVLPGLGSTFALNPMVQFYGGVHRAFAPALNGDALSGLQDQELDAEISTNYEFGVRGQNERLRYEATVFRMDFNNQIIPANSISEFQQTNGGKTTHQGLEAAVMMSLNDHFDVFANATYIPDAEFNGNRLAPDGVTVTTPDGNRVPYVPEVVANAGVIYTVGQLTTQLSALYTGSQFTDVENTRDIQENTSGFFTGQVPSYTIFNLTARYEVDQNLELFGSVKNLTDKDYIASLRQGIYVGPERAFEAGFRYKF